MNPHRFCQPRLIRLPVGRAANSPASTTHGLTLGLFIPSQRSTPTPALDGGEVGSSHGLVATYSPMTSNAARRATGAGKGQDATDQADRISCFSKAARFCRVAAEGL